MKIGSTKMGQIRDWHAIEVFLRAVFFLINLSLTKSTNDRARTNASVVVVV